MIKSGDSIGPYTLVRTIGRGAFGQVWLAEKRSALLTTQVALKMPLVAANDVETVKQEAALWLQASGHPNIVPVLDAEVYDGQVVIASEFIAGGSLHEWMQANSGKAQSVEEAVAITNGILAGLDYLHRVGLTHRDLKPENVLLQYGIPRLTDFGLARVLKTAAQTGTISGTPRYMAPETFSGSYSVASDLWAVGVILQELLTGSNPFPTQEMMALIVAIQSQEPAPLPDSIPERLRCIVTRLLAKSPSDRFASASAVREALQNCLQPVGSVAVTAQDAPVLPPHNLPIQPTSFIGREKQIAELKGLLGHTHLLTLTGSGGCGKTRLSLRVAEEVLEQFPDGVWLVELAPLADPGLVPHTVAEVLGIKETPGETISKTLVSAHREKRLLLVLDNCEHVLEAAAHLADAILRSCQQVRLLVSGREALGIAGESTYQVPSLTVPDSKEPHTPKSVSEYDSVRLFIVRAIAAKSDFAVTDSNAGVLVSVCQRLDGIPLAIELAAARVRSLSVEEINARLDSRFRLLTGGSRTALPRQQTLRALIDWSYDLLIDREKALLCRLSVFAGGWTVEAAEQVCSGEDIEEWEALDLLTSLTDKSLVVADQEQSQHTRYRLLETVRQYARDRLVESGEGERVRERHQAFFVALAEEAEPQLKGSQQTAWLDRLERELDNLRAALEGDNNAAALRLAGALSGFWEVRGYNTEGRKWLAGVLTVAEGQAHTTARAKALLGAGVLARYQGDYTAARRLYEESLTLYRELGDKRGIAWSLNRLAHLPDNEAARIMFEEGLALFQELGDKDGIAWSLNRLGDDAAHQGDFAAARIMIEESLTLRRELGDKHGIAWTLINLGDLAHDQGDSALGRRLYEESLALFRELGDKCGIVWSLHRMGNVASAQGDFASARRLYQESLALLRETEDKGGIFVVLEAFAALALLQEQASRAAQCWGAAEALREAMSAPLAPLYRADYDQQVTEARAAMLEDAFAAAWVEGRAMTMEQAIDYALSEAKS